MSQTRRLAAILAADVAGYSRLIGANEEGTLNLLKSIRAAVVDPSITQYRGRIVKTTGDGLLAEFTSVVDALRCASEIQCKMAEDNADIAAEKRIEFRMGINVGDVVVEDGDIFGDGVNIAARLEGLAHPGGICVSARVQEDATGKLDLAFEDLGEQTLKNIARSVRVYRVRDTASKSPSAFAPSALPLPDKPSIAVLPFANMSGDPEQDYFADFADGMVEEIITALSRIRWLFVIARNSSFTYKGQSVDVKQVGRELGVRYVREGSVRKAGQRVRITGQLIDALSGTHLWADRFDGSLEDVFDLQDKVAISVAGMIEPTLRAAEILRSSKRPTSDLTAYDLYLQALPLAWSAEKSRIVQALDLLGKAVNRDQNYGPAFALAAVCHNRLHVSGWSSDPEAERRESVDLARRAVRATGDDPVTLGIAAHALAYGGEDIAAAIALIDRSLDLNPSYAGGWHESGWLRLWAGQPDLAIEHFKTGLRLSPRDRNGNPALGIGVAHFFARRFQEARGMLLQSLDERPTWVPTYRFLAACYAHMGRLCEARETVERLRAMTPVVIPAAAHWRNPEHRELYLSGLRLAMGEA